MANHGTPLTTKNLKKFAGTVTLNLPEIDNDLAGDFGNNGDAVSLILKTAFTRANLDETLAKLGKMAASTEPKSQPVPQPLLIPVGTATVAATEEPIVLSPEVLRERYNIKWRGSNFDAWYLGRTLASFGGSTLAYKKLSRRSVDGPIIAGLGGTLLARMELAEMLGLVKVQKYGPKSKSGPLLTDGSANISYVEDEIRFPEDEPVAYTNEAGQKVVLRAVSVGWGSDGDGWSVSAGAVTYPSTWFAGIQVFSRDSRSPLAA
jgi:hypothetical protein